MFSKDQEKESRNSRSLSIDENIKESLNQTAKELQSYLTHLFTDLSDNFVSKFVSEKYILSDVEGCNIFFLNWSDELHKIFTTKIEELKVSLDSLITLANANAVKRHTMKYCTNEKINSKDERIKIYKSVGSPQIHDTMRPRRKPFLPSPPKPILPETPLESSAIFGS